jgi:hypothetical protein
MVAAGESLAGAVGAEDVSADCPAGEAPVGTAVKSSPFAKTLKKAVRITATFMPAKMRSQRGPFILRTSPRQSQLRRVFPKLAPAFGDCLRLSPYNSPDAH